MANAAVVSSERVLDWLCAVRISVTFATDYTEFAGIYLILVRVVAVKCNLYMSLK